ncbi:hypothetical protein ABH905_005275 [Pseudomonas frederiksbergensis]|uniref:hypothetical protein n=1 Tax=Pseudomonas frederiksbergensis TaxID=104087 RepID=UPI003D1EDC89
MPILDAPRECPIKSHYGKHSVYFPSQKNQTQIVCDSTLEADYCVLLEFEPTVERYQSRPGIFKISVDERIHDYTPDFLVETTELVYYTEIKLDFTKLSARVNAKLQAASCYFNQLGRLLRFADENSIRRGEYLRNLKYLYLHSFNVGADERGDCARQLEALTLPIRLGDLLTKQNGPSTRSIYKAIFDQVLIFDLRQRLTINTQLEVRNDGHQHSESWCSV